MPLAEPASNPGWVDMVGLGCEAGVDQAAWRVSVHSPHVRKLPYDMQTHFRAVIPAEAEEEAILLGTRMCEGISLSSFRSEFGRDFPAGREAAVQKLVEGGLAVLDRDAFFLTERGLELQSAAVLELL